MGFDYGIFSSNKKHLSLGRPKDTTKSLKMMILDTFGFKPVHWGGALYFETHSLKPGILLYLIGKLMVSYG